MSEKQKKNETAVVADLTTAEIGGDKKTGKTKKETGETVDLELSKKRHPRKKKEARKK